MKVSGISVGVGAAVFAGVLWVFYLALSGDNADQGLGYNADFSDWELADAQSLSQNRIKSAPVADKAAQEILGIENKDKVPPPPPPSPSSSDDSDDAGASENKSKGKCGGRDNLECIPSGKKKGGSESKVPPPPPPPGSSVGLVSSGSGGSSDSSSVVNRPLSRREALLGMSSGKTGRVGVNKDVVVDSDKWLKKGSTYYGFIPEGVVVSSGGIPQDLVVHITAQGSRNANRKPYLLYATATLSGKRVKISVSDCVALHRRKLSIPCKAQVSSVVGGGGPGLNGEVYDPSVYGKLLQIVANGVSAFHLASITQRVTSAGEILQSSHAEQVHQSLASAWVEVGKEAKSALSGSKVVVAPGAIVKILIREDVRLW